ncbi:DUF3060 domain-containing protein [Mycobacterium sp. NPDC003323]
MASLSVLSRSATAGALAAAMLLAGTAPAQAKNGDTHVTGQGIVQTIDCNNATLLVNGTGNTINAKGTCWAVTLQGSSNIVIADNVINDITVYGYDQTVIYHNGAPALIDRGRELGMTNRINWAPA